MTYFTYIHVNDAHKILTPVRMIISMDLHGAPPGAAPEANITDKLLKSLGSAAKPVPQLNKRRLGTRSQSLCSGRGSPAVGPVIHKPPPFHLKQLVIYPKYSWGVLN